MPTPIYPRRLASDDPIDAAILEARDRERRTQDAQTRLEAMATLMDFQEQYGAQWVHDVLMSIAACRGEDVCGKDRR